MIAYFVAPTRFAPRAAAAKSIANDKAVSTPSRTSVSGPTRTYGEMKRLLLSTHDQPLETQLEFEARAISQCAKTEDSWNAIQAVLGKSRPEFSGR